MHPNQLPVSEQSVRTLLREQCPEWSALPVRQLSTAGTDNAIFRLGEHLAARFPLQANDIELARQALAGESRAARALAAATRFPVPEVLYVGAPGADYPMPWSVQRWLPGHTGEVEDPAESTGFAADLAEFILAVRTIAPHGWTREGGRGGVLADEDDWMRTCLERSEGLLDVPRLSRMWTEFRELAHPGAETMNHRDLIPGNVLVAEGRLAGVLDVSGFAPADPAVDLVSAWHLLDAPSRRLLRAELGCADLEWERGRAWAFQQAMGLVWYYLDSNPAMSALGRRTLHRLTERDR